MRRNNNKPSSQGSGGYSQGNGGYNNQHRRPRHHSGGGGGQGGGNHNRPRKNYSAMREKYQAQARDALSAGDRVLAENYFQHAEHCYRMMVEEGYNPRQQVVNNEAQGGVQEAPASQEQEEQTLPASPNALPAFITSTAFPPMDQEMAKEPVIVQNWEEN